MMKVNQNGVLLSICLHRPNGPMSSILHIPTMLITAMQTCILSTRYSYILSSQQTTPCPLTFYKFSPFFYYIALFYPTQEKKIGRNWYHALVFFFFQLRESKGMPTIKLRPHCGEVFVFYCCLCFYSFTFTKILMIFGTFAGGWCWPFGCCFPSMP